MHTRKRRISSGPDAFDAAELRLFARLKTPRAIQDFLDQLDYSSDPIYRSPRSVLRDRKAHCFDGALFAAAALERQGRPALLCDLRAHNDDDHVLAIFRGPGGFGAIAQSNFVTLRWREPLYRTLRELALSYFEFYYNTQRQKTLREYSRALPLARFDRCRWRTSDEQLESIATALDRVRHEPIAPAAVLRKLAPIDERSYAAGLLGSNPAGLFRPKS